MRDLGVQLYGRHAYGPDGTLIDTNLPFSVFSEFVSISFSELWALKTTLRQGENEIKLEVDCREYIEQLYEMVEGGSGYFISTWDNLEGVHANFEPEVLICETTSCSQAVQSISNIRFMYDGS